jgi:hypothetical protein
MKILSVWKKDLLSCLARAGVEVFVSGWVCKRFEVEGHFS